jgi:glycosyltransferase involved in cell wall biosynthesis
MSLPAESSPLQLLSVVIPARDEEGCVAATIEHLHAELCLRSVPHEIVVVDDGSTDSTSKIIADLAGHIPELIALSNPGPHGFGRAIIYGLDRMRGDAVVILMADESDDCRDVVRYWELLNQGYDAVFGSRFMRGGSVSDYPRVKLVVKRAAKKKRRARSEPQPDAPKKVSGQDVIDWIEKYCRIPEGKHVGELVQLEPWQKTEIKKIYDNEAGTRRAILSFPRKNAKTSLSAFLLLNHLCGKSSIVNSQLFSTAQSREQAGVIFSLAAKIVRLGPELRAVVTVRDTAKELLCIARGTKYRALSAEARRIVRTANSSSPSSIRRCR